MPQSAFAWNTPNGLEMLAHMMGQQARDDIAWAESLHDPASAEEFAAETIYVICNSGMKNTVARGIYDRVMLLVRAGKSASEGFGHKGKTHAIDDVWTRRETLFRTFNSVAPADRLEFLASLPWIGHVTKYHLAKNFGLDCCKPDVHLERLARHARTSPGELCRRLANATGWRVATVDTLLWRACALGWVNSTTGEQRDGANH